MYFGTYSLTWEPSETGETLTPWHPGVNRMNSFPLTVISAGDDLHTQWDAFIASRAFATIRSIPSRSQVRKRARDGSYCAKKSRSMAREKKS